MQNFVLWKLLVKLKVKIYLKTVLMAYTVSWKESSVDYILGLLWNIHSFIPHGKPRNILSALTIIGQEQLIAIGLS